MPTGGLGIAVIGTIKVMESDEIDKLPFAVAPLKYMEETLSMVALGYALFEFAKTVHEEPLQ